MVFTFLFGCRIQSAKGAVRHLHSCLLASLIWTQSMMFRRGTKRWDNPQRILVPVHPVAAAVMETMVCLGVHSSGRSTVFSPGIQWYVLFFSSLLPPWSSLHHSGKAPKGQEEKNQARVSESLSFCERYHEASCAHGGKHCPTRSGYSPRRGHKVKLFTHAPGRWVVVVVDQLHPLPSHQSSCRERRVGLLHPPPSHWSSCGIFFLFSSPQWEEALSKEAVLGINTTISFSQFTDLPRAEPCLVWLGNLETQASPCCIQQSSFLPLCRLTGIETLGRRVRAFVSIFFLTRTHLEYDHWSLENELWIYTSYMHGAFDWLLVIMQVYGIQYWKGMNIRFRQHGTSEAAWNNLIKMATTRYPGTTVSAKWHCCVIHYAISSDKKQLSCDSL